MNHAGRDGAPIDFQQSFAISAASGDYAGSLDGVFDAVATDSVVVSTWAAGARGSLGGVGSFGVSGVVTSESSITGVLTLTGADTLTVDLGDIDARGCAAAAVDGVAVERICAFTPDEVASTATTVIDGERGCSGDDWLLSVTVDGAAVRASAIVASGDESEWHVLSEVRVDDDERRFEAALAFGTWVDDDKTRLACSSTVPVLLRAEDSEGLALACGTLGSVDADTLDNFCSEVSIVALDG